MMCRNFADRRAAFIATPPTPVGRSATAESDKHLWRTMPGCFILSLLSLRQRWNMHRPRISIRFIPGLVLGLVAVGPVVAAPSLGDIDWDSYLDWHSYTDWHSWLLIGSIVLLILA